MRYSQMVLSFLCLLFVFSAGSQELPKNMKKIEGGTYQSFFVKTGTKPAKLRSFYLSEHAVTNAEYLAFVKANPEWSKSKAKKLFVDDSYLKHWKNDTSFNDGISANSPVVYVSWFAANAYCRWKGLRLPTTAEWERAGAAKFVWPKKLASLSVEQAVLNWYEQPSLKVVPNVESINKNTFGLYDMHGLIWEWVSDFNSFIGSADSRSNDTGSSQFCAAGSLNAADRKAYATFLRYSFRGSLKGRYCIANLGFRCARDL